MILIPNILAIFFRASGSVVTMANRPLSAFRAVTLPANAAHLLHTRSCYQLPKLGSLLRDRRSTYFNAKDDTGEATLRLRMFFTDE
jgi:hypothetical protein